ncbi:hypothetical protein, conserved in T. vivax [Trypanosoma vivax Y486]|uniref:Uncharacterized protein n=1 Tax=Trypanosoma vivax (strain Y486) TaxID=1055687 RepID=F9WL77_TRYVY|nr:hypothetical protein, conserved in T. vivax [Trypanosoma vivax Y486]|eukprot:CCD18264.1 hypothetical protein, conserved in T. vivax [Trypanosoma vivax Y486]
MLLSTSVAVNLSAHCALPFSALDTPHAAFAFASFTAFSWPAPHRATHSASKSHNLPQKQVAVPSPIIVPRHSSRSVPVTNCECWCRLALASPKRAPPCAAHGRAERFAPSAERPCARKGFAPACPCHPRARPFACVLRPVRKSGVASVSDHELRCARVDWAGLAAQSCPLTPCRCPALVANLRGWRRARAAALTRASGWQTVPEPCGRRQDAARSTEARRLALALRSAVSSVSTKTGRRSCAVDASTRCPMAAGRESASAGRLPATKGQRARQTSYQRAVAQNAWNALHAAGPSCARSRAPRRTSPAQSERRRTGRRSRATMAANEHRAQGAHNTSARRQRHGEAPHRGRRTPADLRRRAAPNSLPRHKQQRREGGQCDACAPNSRQGREAKNLYDGPQATRGVNECRSRAAPRHQPSSRTDAEHRHAAGSECRTHSRREGHGCDAKRVRALRGARERRPWGTQGSGRHTPCCRIEARRGDGVDTPKEAGHVWRRARHSTECAVFPRTDCSENGTMYGKKVGRKDACGAPQ